MTVEVSSVLRLLERYGLILECEGDVEDAVKELEVNWLDETEDIRLTRERLCELLEEGQEVI